MKKTRAAAVLALLAATSVASAQVPVPNISGPQPTAATGQTGTPEVQRGLSVTGQALLAKRLGIISYCGDLSPNAGDFGYVGRQEWFKGENPIWEATPIGYFGAQNLVDMINYDDTIPRFREVHMIDGDREQPTAAQLANNFDCVIALTDNKCAPANQAAIYTQAANALQGFVATPGKGAVLTGMAFNTTTGFGDAIFGPTLSPFRKASAQLDARCSPDHPCTIGSCPAGAVRMIVPSISTAPECFTCSLGGTPIPDPNNAGLFVCPAGEDPVFAEPVFTPVTKTSDFICEGLVQGVNGPTSSSLASAFAQDPLRPTATACLNYLNGIPLLAVNASRNVVALNVMPTYVADLKKTWFSCIVANAAILACGEKRCTADANNPRGYRCN